MESRRIEALADGVFAVAMTLLVLQVHVPDVSGMIGIDALTSILPTAGSFAVSFLILGTLWVGHHNQYRRLQRVDAALVWTNLFLLLCVAFLTFATAFLARYPLQRAPLLLYGGVLLLAGVLLFAHWGHAVSAGLVADDVSPEAAELVRERISMGMVMTLAATIVGAFLPKVGLVLFACLPIAYMLPDRVDPSLTDDATTAE